jgi:hypothetical protein
LTAKQILNFLVNWPYTTDFVSFDSKSLPQAQKIARPIDPVFRADSVVLAISAEKDGNLQVVYARIGRCQGRPAWRGA